MIYVQIDKCRFGTLLVFILFCTGTAADLCKAGEASEKATPTGELKLEGQHIERLVLRRNDGHTETLSNPGETIKLPAGEYLLQDVRLKGGYIRNRITTVERITIRAGQQEFLKGGAPLVPTIKVQREGRILVMNYELRGAGGETYTGGDRSKPPTFAVYKNQKKIASGKFEFG
jgi:hypothetical protein